jgi:hypothetical protein
LNFGESSSVFVFSSYYSIDVFSGNGDGSYSIIDGAANIAVRLPLSELSLIK